MHPLVREVLAHRYLYYVLSQPVITDYDYDMLERRARQELPTEETLFTVGSSRPEDYPEEVVSRARELLDVDLL